MQTLNVFRSAAMAALASSSFLTACGGGGGDTAASSAPSTGVRENYAQVLDVPASTYAANGGEAAVYARLNEMRLDTNAGALTQASLLDTAAARHLTYLTANYPYIGDNESTDKASFYGATVSARAQLAGYAGTVLEMVGSDTGPTATPQTCVNSLLNAPYAANVLLQPWRDVGLAYGVVHAVAAGSSSASSAASTAATPATTTTDVQEVACVVVLGIAQGKSGQLPDAGTLKTYPWPDQSEVPFSFGPAAAGFNPAPDLQNAQGAPVQVSMDDFGALAQSSFSVSSFTLTDIDGQTVPTRLIVNSATKVADNTTFYVDPTGALPSSDVLLLPLSPLLPDHVYTIQFTGSNGATHYDQSWSFTTSASD